MNLNRLVESYVTEAMDAPAVVRTMVQARESVVRRARKERLAIISAVLNETVVRFGTRPSRDELRELVQTVVRALEGRSVTTLFQRTLEALDVREVERTNGRVEFVVYDAREHEGYTRFQQWRHYLTRALHGGGTTQPTFQELDDELLVQRFRLVVAHPRVASTEEPEAVEEEPESVEEEEEAEEEEAEEEVEETEEEEEEETVEDREWSLHAHGEEPSVEERQALSGAGPDQPSDWRSYPGIRALLAEPETGPDPGPDPEGEHEWYARRSREIMREDAQRSADESAIGSAYSTDLEMTQHEVDAWRRNHPDNENATSHERALNRYVDAYMAQQARTRHRSLAKSHLQRIQQRLEEEMGRVAEGCVFGEGAYVEISNALRQAFLVLEEL